MVTIDRERLISEKQNNIASAEGARSPKEAMLLRDIIKFTKPSMKSNATCSGLILSFHHTQKITVVYF